MNNSSHKTPTLWAARDKDGSLWLYNVKPEIAPFGTFFRQVSFDYPPIQIIDKSLFPEVTFQNSPKQLKLTLCDT